MSWLGFLLILPHIMLAMGVQVLTRQEYKKYVKEGQWETPACILFHSNESHILQRYSKVFMKKKNDIKFFTVEKHLIGDQKIVPYTKCYIGQSTQKDFVFKNKRKGFLKWINSLDTILPYKLLTDPNLEKLSVKDNVFILVMIPGIFNFESSEKLMNEVIESNDGTLKVDAYMVPPDTECERTLFKKQMVSIFPSGLLLHRNKAYERAELVKEFVGSHEVTAMFIKLYLLVEKMKSFVVSAEQFELYTNFKHYVESPVLLYIYSSQSESSYLGLHAFHRTLLEFSMKKRTVQFGIFDISERLNGHALERNVKVSVSSLPFVLCVHQHGEGSSKIRQKSMKHNSIPTIHAVELFLQTLQLMPSLKSKGIPHFEMCASNITDVCMVGDEFNAENIVEEKTRKIKTRAVKRRRKSGELRYITEKMWNRIFATEKPSKYHFSKRKNVFSESRLLLVIFIREGCSFCDIAMSEFRRVAKEVAYLPNLFVYLMNCTENTLRCKQLSITGFPTLLLFRVVSAYEHKQCLPAEYFLQPAVTDYHGNFEADEILAWLSASTLPVITFPEAQQNISAEWKERNIRLKARLFSKAFASRYLPRSINNKLLPLKCFLVMCELLYAQVSCVGLPEDNTLLHRDEKELVVSSVEFQRRDGAHVMLFKTGVPMKRSLTEEESVGSSFFHHTHRYNISSTFRCEDNHVKCDHVMMEFINDHAHMPVTHINTGMFHSHQKGNSYLGKKPILMSLAHSKNITQHSKFYQQLYDVAVKLYKDVNVAVLDVDQHSHWANLFVPRGYYSQSYASNDDFKLHRYPRFCLIDIDDHRHAAFYPTIEEDGKGGIKIAHAHISGTINENELVVFVNKYLFNRSVVTMETEHF